MKKQEITLSIIITAHKEGLYLHKTILSVLESLKTVDKKYTYEIIINLDNADKETAKIANAWQEKDPKISCFNVSFGNPADNRNDAINKSTGKFIAILDGDDMVSENWFSVSISILEKNKKPVVVRPNYHIEFGYDNPHPTIWKMRGSSDKQTDAIQMAYWNLWTIAFVAHRQILLETPYKAPINGFGFEDYLFNTEVVSKEIPQIIADNTILFYRRRRFSTSSLHVNTILDYSSLFDIDYFKSIKIDSSSDTKTKEPVSNKSKRLFKKAYRFAFDFSKKIKPLRELISPIAINILEKKNSAKFPQEFFTMWKKINKIDNQLWPTKTNIATLNFHPLSLDPFENRFGVIYLNLCKQLSGNRLDYLFLAPEMSGRGGTEKLIANYIKALQKIHPEWKIGILSTQPFNDLTIDYFKDLSVDMIDFGRLTNSVGDYEKNIIWSRLLVQSKVKKIHIVNDEYWYRWVSYHMDLIQKNNYEINISLFMREFTHEKNRIQTFSDPHLAEIWPAVNKVFTDNQKVIDQALENNAFDIDKFSVHYQPEDSTDITKPKSIDSSKKIKVLWASRIAFQKRPDILKKISKNIGDDFEIDAYGIIEKRQYPENYFKDSNVNYKGIFKGIGSIDTEKYDIYLYTSQTDGIPNILMEVSKAGLPIVASNVGGVSEFLQEGSGILVDLEDINGYIEALNSLKNNPEKANQMAQKSQKILKSQHSWEKFEENVKKDL